jgi:NADH dehydrogenase
MSERSARIVIIGAGFAGAYCAQALEKKLKGRNAEIVLVDRHNYFVFYPLLVEAGTGSLQPRHAVVSLRSFLRRSRFLMGEAVAIEPDANRVRVRLAGAEQDAVLDYDHCVLALGSVTSLPPVPGLREHAFEMKSLTDAVALRDRAIQHLERADAADDPALRRRLLHFVVVGGSFTGVEVAGEFIAFLRQASKRYPRVMAEDCRVSLVELRDRILPALDEDLSRYAAKQLERQGVTLHLERGVAVIEAESVQLDDGVRLDAQTVIWCAGIAAPPPLWEEELPVDALGYLRCAPDLRVVGQERIWGIGDCAVNVDSRGEVYPATAQHAVREGLHLARNLAAVLEGDEAKPLDYRSVGSLAALGCRTGVAKLLGIKLSGFWAWFLWRTIYLLKMPGWSRRLRVAIDWSLDLLFPKDYVELGLHRGERGNDGPST